MSNIIEFTITILRIFAIIFVSTEVDWIRKMCSYNKIDKNYIFDGDLEQYLLDKGLEAEHIKKMKAKILQPNKDFYYDSHWDDKKLYKCETRLVSLSKVIGTSRGTIGKSVFDNVRSMKDGEREPHRFKLCFSFLDTMILEELRASYEKLFYPVIMQYYKEEDEYFLTEDGNHRTLTAMLLGAENIKATVTTMYCNYEKRDKYYAVEKFYKDFNIIQINQLYWSTTEIIFAESDGYFVVDGFSIRRDENCYEYISKLSGEIQEDMKLVKIWTRLPKIIRTILAMFCNNKRVIQYINKSQKSHGNRRIDIYNYD